MEYETITKALIVKRKGAAIFDVSVTEVDIDDETGGPFVVVRQHPNHKDTQEIRIGEEDWPAIRRAVESMMIVCRGQGEGE
jgi:hypothetical protein